MAKRSGRVPCVRSLLHANAGPGRSGSSRGGSRRCCRRAAENMTTAHSPRATMIASSGAMPSSSLDRNDRSMGTSPPKDSRGTRESASRADSRGDLDLHARGMTSAPSTSRPRRWARGSARAAQLADHQAEVGMMDRRRHAARPAAHLEGGLGGAGPLVGRGILHDRAVGQSQRLLAMAASVGDREDAQFGNAHEVRRSWPRSESFARKSVEAPPGPPPRSSRSARGRAGPGCDRSNARGVQSFWINR